MPWAHGLPYWSERSEAGDPILTRVPQMCIRVRLFASYREAAGTNRLETPLPPGATVSDLIDVLAVNLPALKKAR